MDLISILSFLVGAAGFGYAIYQGSEKKKLDQFVKNQAWHNLSLVRRAWGTQQDSFNKYKETFKDNPDSELIEQLSKAETFLHTLYLESIRQIQLTERHIDVHTVNMWVYIGRISKDQAKVFLETTPFNPPGIFGSMKIQIHRYLQEKFANYQAKLNKPKEPDKLNDNE